MWRSNMSDAMKNVYHDFLPVERDKGGVFCGTCSEGPGAIQHNILSATGRIMLHRFENKPGISDCGLCGFAKDHETHTKSSDSDDTYRKPIAVRFDLIPPIALRRLAAIYEEGAKVYGESRYISEPMQHSNVVNHLISHLNLAQSGDATEDHWAKVAWAAFTMMVYTEFDLGEHDLASYGVRPKASRK